MELNYFYNELQLKINKLPDDIEKGDENPYTKIHSKKQIVLSHLQHLQDMNGGKCLYSQSAAKSSWKMVLTFCKQHESLSDFKDDAKLKANLKDFLSRA